VINELELAISDIVVNGLGHAGGHQVQPALVSQSSYLVSRVHGVIATNVEEVADIVSTHDINDPRKVFPLRILELVAAGANGAGSRSDAQQSNLLSILRRKIQKLLFEHPLDPVITTVNLAEFVRHLTAGLNDAAQRVINHC